AALTARMLAAVEEAGERDPRAGWDHAAAADVVDVTDVADVVDVTGEPSGADGWGQKYPE
ncbi:MAG: hypothetical protein WCK77_17040, partial [Verrucomicrobiota bacterium]